MEEVSEWDAILEMGSFLSSEWDTVALSFVLTTDGLMLQASHVVQSQIRKSVGNLSQRREPLSFVDRRVTGKPR